MPLTPQPKRPSPMPPPPPIPDIYRITVHPRDLRRFVLRPYWATVTIGPMKMGESGAGVWRARSRKKLIAKVERSLRKDARRRGISDPTILVNP